MLIDVHADFWKNFKYGVVFFLGKFGRFEERSLEHRFYTRRRCTLEKQAIFFVEARLFFSKSKSILRSAETKFSSWKIAVIFFFREMKNCSMMYGRCFLHHVLRCNSKSFFGTLKVTKVFYTFFYIILSTKCWYPVIWTSNGEIEICKVFPFTPHEGSIPFLDRNQEFETGPIKIFRHQIPKFCIKNAHRIAIARNITREWKSRSIFDSPGPPRFQYFNLGLERIRLASGGSAHACKTFGAISLGWRGSVGVPD